MRKTPKNPTFAHQKRHKKCKKNHFSMSKTPDSTDFPHWENPRICCTCIHYAGAECRCNLIAFHFPPEHPACPRYIPKKTD